MANRSRSSRAARQADAPYTARRRRRKRWLLALLVIPALLAALAGVLVFYLVFASVPLPDDIAARPSVVYDVYGEEVGDLAAEAGYEEVAFDALPDHVTEAVITAEDRSFYEHRGVSLTGIARALFTNVRAGEIRGGGSTITQQYIKNVALSPEQSYRRKVREAALAIKLEQAYDKDEILGFYLDTAYWGRGTTGIGAAARAYFGVDASELDVNQSATLAGILPAPESYDPAEHPERAETRRRYVLDGMLEEGYLDAEEHETLVAAGLPEVSEPGGVDPGPNAYYVEAVRRQLAATGAFEPGELLRGLRVHTALDPRLQAAAQDTLREAVAEGPTDTGAIVSVDPDTGGVRALVGGPDYAAQPFNTALRSVRQPGSTFKAFTLQAFLEQGGSLSTGFPAPAQVEVDGANQPIRNYAGVSYGEQSVRQATATSSNTVYVQMQEETGRDAVIEAATRAGLPERKDEEVFPTEREPGETLQPLAGLTLGQDLFSPLEMAAAYATFAGEGVVHTPHLVRRVEDMDGRVVYEPEVVSRPDVELEVARTVTEALVGVVAQGSGTAAALEDRPAAGKTGTTNDARDVWFVGYVPQLATALWLGNLDNSPIEAGDATGGGLAAPWWQQYMNTAVEGFDVEEFVPPEGDEEVVVDDEPRSCPDGYRFAAPPAAVDEDGFYPDVLTEIVNEDGLPCVQVKPELEPCPEGYAYAEPPEGPDESGRLPDVIDDRNDFQGRPCVEILREPSDAVGEPGGDGAGESPPDGEPDADTGDPSEGEAPAPAPAPAPDEDAIPDDEAEDGGADPGGGEAGEADQPGEADQSDQEDGAPQGASTAEDGEEPSVLRDREGSDQA